jgi:Rrf2 family protein
MKSIDAPILLEMVATVMAEGNTEIGDPSVFSRPTEYALRAMTVLAALPSGKLGGALEIAQREHIPAPFLWKILRTLTRKKLIRSFKGLRGGYELAKPASRISLASVIRAMEKREVQSCLLGLPGCNPRNPCPLHPLEKKIQLMLQRTSLSDLARATHIPKRRRAVSI